ncbi:MAG: HEAT repeat domain-containing protein [Planctomycetota bacterium]
MRIYFCDACNESIPLVDIQAGQVTTIKGKLFCRNCIPPGAGSAAPAAPTRAAGGSAQLLLWLLVLALIAYVVWREVPLAEWGLRAGNPGEAETRHELQGLEDSARLTGLDSELRALAGARDEIRRQLAFVSDDLDGLRSELADFARGLEHAVVQIEGLTRSQAETGALIEKLNFVENRAQLLESRIDALADMVAAQAQRLTLGLAERDEVTGLVAAVPGVDLTKQAELEELRRQLLDGDAGRRFGAVDRVDKGRLKALAPDLVPMLADEDSFVRLLVMQVLGDFGYAEAVPALFDVLSDPSASIRKAAAETLVRLTAFDPGFDPRATQAEREKAVKRWRDWYATR